MIRYLLGAVILITSSILVQTSLAARGGGFASENPLAAEHIGDLPIEIRRSLKRFERECGAPVAGHHFSTSIEASGRRFIALHFETFYCPGSLAICDEDGCLHEIFAETPNGRVRVFAMLQRKSH